LSYKQKKFLSKEGAMKRIVMLTMVLEMMLVSIGGCWVGWDEGGRGGRGGGHDRDQRHEERCWERKERIATTPVT
jgi:hypothetical protein